MNENYYIYKLARVEDKTTYHYVDVDMDSGITENAVYYGLTQDPKMRLSKHRPLKGQDISMIVMKQFDNAWEALEHEAHLVAAHYRAFGAPELQGMANSGHRGA